MVVSKRLEGSMTRKKQNTDEPKIKKSEVNEKTLSAADQAAEPENSCGQIHKKKTVSFDKSPEVIDTKKEK